MKKENPVWTKKHFLITTHDSHVPPIIMTPQQMTTHKA